MEPTRVVLGRAGRRETGIREADVFGDGTQVRRTPHEYLTTGPGSGRRYVRHTKSKAEKTIKRGHRLPRYKNICALKI